MYTDKELALIREIISGDAISEGTNLDAINLKLSEDMNFKKYKAFAFFPEIYDTLYNSNAEVQAYSCGETRGQGIMYFTPGKKIVIKPVQRGLQTTLPQDADEIPAAEFAAKIDFGPKQYRTLNGYITEEFLDGKTILKAASENLDDECLYNYGTHYGEGLKKMHEANFLYNDTSIADDFGKTHIIITNNRLKLIDFGAAISIKNHPEYSDEQVFNYGRTMPGGFVVHMDNFNLPEFLAGNRKMLSKLSKEELFLKDLYFVNTGVTFASQRLDKNLQPFYEGFKAKYNN